MTIMATDTSKLAPRIIINEHDITASTTIVRNNPITLLFGFSPIGRTCEPVYCNTALEIT